jgi:hypothetical protein
MLKTEAPAQIIIDEHSVIIVHGNDRVIVPRDVYEAKRQLERSSRFGNAIGQMVHGAASDNSVKGIGLKTQPDERHPPVYVPREQFAVFDSRSTESSGSREIVEIANLEISRAILERGNRRWEFYWRGIKIAAPVLDQRFYDRFFAHEITIAPGDGLRVMLRITQNANEDTGIFVNQKYEVVEVLEYIPRIVQREF